MSDGKDEIQLFIQQGDLAFAVSRALASVSARAAVGPPRDASSIL
ncbi:MAG TPA: hypothetical protein VMJ70_12680 [Candidatus Sulfotelmatobacter sp.]|nr:hypothetical protein [Candidatus Sulfotelmatobacter sp.]